MAEIRMTRAPEAVVRAAWATEFEWVKHYRHGWVMYEAGAEMPRERLYRAGWLAAERWHRENKEVGCGKN